MKISKINQKNFKEILKIAVNSIRKGKIIICPTDTVYGLVCDATNEKAVKKLFKIKKRPKEKAIPIFVKDIKMTKKIAQIDKRRGKILKKVWPGKVTVVLKQTRLRPSGFGGRRKIKLYGVEKKTIALRIPKYKLVNELLKKLNLPLSGTSANISGKPPSIKIKEIIKQFKNQKYQPDLILDSGNLKSSRPSTVIDLTGKKIKILRK